MTGEIAAVILAAGQGTRMRSNTAKVLHRVAGKPMVEYGVASAKAAGVSRTVVVVGYQADRVRAALGDRAEFVEQPARQGTGDAVKCARALLEGKVEQVLVYYADMPLLQSETLCRIIEKQRATRAALTMLTVRSQDTMSFGRILRNSRGEPVQIVEEVEATPEQLAITEINPGVYCFEASWLWENLARLEPSPKKGEYYLTDLLVLAVAQEQKVETITTDDVAQVIGINTRAQLAQAERVMRDRIRERLMLNGTTLIDPASTYIDAEVEIGQDTVVLPNTHLMGRTRIGSECRIGPNAVLADSTVGNRCTIGPSVLEGATVEDEVDMGPFCHLRRGAHLARHVHLGNYAEVKNSHLGEGVHMGHFSYMGDAQVGAGTNIAAGTITCNYDGKNKNRTVIGSDVFIGSDSMLVAPVAIGDGARTGAGAVVTKDIPAHTLAVGVPARVIRKLA